MSVRLLNDALALNVKQSPADTALLFVIAWRSQDGEGCTANVETLARWSKLTVRSVRRCLASLERNGLIRREPMRKAHGIGWRYAVTLTASATGDRMSPVADDGDTGDRMSPVADDGDTGDRMSADSGRNVPQQGTERPPTADGMSPNRNTCIDSDRARANARPRDGEERITANYLIEVARKIGVPERDCACFAFATWNKWEEQGMMAGRNRDIPVTRRNAETLMRQYWQYDYENPTRRTVRDGI